MTARTLRGLDDASALREATEVTAQRDPASERVQNDRRCALLRTDRVKQSATLALRATVRDNLRSPTRHACIVQRRWRVRALTGETRKTPVIT